MNAAWRPPPPADELDRAPTTATTQKATITASSVRELLARVEQRDRPRVSAPSSASFPAEVTASAPFAIEETRIRPAKARGRGEQRRREAAWRRARRRRAASSAVASEREVGGADRDVGSADADLDARQVARAEQAEDDGDEEDGEGEIFRRPPQRSWERARASGETMIGADSPVRGAPVDRMRIAFLTGIWPPDVGGPATHGPDFSRFLVARGHGVHVVTMGDGEPAERPVRGGGRLAAAAVPASLRPGRARGARAARAGGRRLRVRDLCRRRCAPRRRAPAARREARLRPGLRARRRYGLFAGTLEEFQRARLARRCACSRRCATRRCAGRHRSSCRARTWPGSPQAGGSTATGSTC